MNLIAEPVRDNHLRASADLAASPCCTVRWGIRRPHPLPLRDLAASLRRSLSRGSVVLVSAIAWDGIDAEFADANIAAALRAWRTVMARRGHDLGEAHGLASILNESGFQILESSVSRAPSRNREAILGRMAEDLDGAGWRSPAASLREWATRGRGPLTTTTIAAAATVRFDRTA